GPAKTGEEKKETEIKVSGNVGKIEDYESGGLDPDKVASAIRNRYQQGVINCYRQGLKSNPNLSGKVSVRFTVGPAGSVTAVKITEGMDAGVDRCVQN